MALSEREQKVLDQLEELMSNEDPHFASSMSSTGNTAPVFSARHLAVGILFVLIHWPGHHYWCSCIEYDLAGCLRLPLRGRWRVLRNHQ